ncbi:MAG: hypothetical protein M3P99_02100 [Pseudomonadota bacterium]|nr:hypothetical protein [Pseudomonadota bacterium]
MRKAIAILCGTAVLGLAGQAVAQTTMKEKKMATKEMRMKAMDANNDGMVSKDEFTKYHETMWEKTKRNAQGMAMMGDVNAMYGPGTVPSAIPGEPRMKAKP